MSHFPAGRIAGIDFGTRRVGIAISDPGQHFASPLGTYTRKSLEKDSQYFRELTRCEEIIGFVVGLPVHMSGDESEKSQQARAWGAWLAMETERAVEFFDERYSTALANDILREGNLSPTKRKELRDRIAAQVILSSFLEKGSAGNGCEAVEG